MSAGVQNACKAHLYAHRRNFSSFDRIANQFRMASRQRADRIIRVSITLAIAAATLCACSSPYIYQKEVGSFSSSVTSVSDGITQGIDNLTQDQAAADLAEVANARAGVDLAPACGQESATEPCRIMVHGGAPDSYIPGKFQDSAVKEQKVLAVLKSYAEGLTAVTNAQDRKDYDAAASQLASSVAGLGTALGSVFPAGAAAGPALKAVVTFATWSLGEDLDAARFDTLKSAINSVGEASSDLGGQSAIEVVADEAITPALRAIRSARLQLLYRQLQARQDQINLDLKMSDSSSTELASLIAALNTVRAVDPATVGKSLVTAHANLMKAVNDKSRQFPSLLSSISDFANQAAAVEKAFTKKSTPVTSK